MNTQNIKPFKSKALHLQKTQGVFRKWLKDFFIRSWWVWLFMGCCYLFYSHFVQKKWVIYAELEQRFNSLTLEKQAALNEQEDLLLQVHSQDDPAWIRMTLMKRLGLVPEGQTKVYFQKEEE